MAGKKPSVSRVEIYKDEAGEFRWRGIARNGRVIAESGEGYNNRMYCQKMARALFPLAVIQFL